MNFINQYLEQHGQYSEDYARSHFKYADVIQYDDDLIEELSASVNKEKSRVLLELLIMENKYPVLVINTDAELIKAIDNKEPFLYITPEYREERSEWVGAVLRERDLVGLELGSKGGIHAKESLITWFQNRFSSESDETKHVLNKLRAYRLRENDRAGMLLYKQTLTY